MLIKSLHYLFLLSLFSTQVESKEKQVKIKVSETLNDKKLTGVDITLIVSHKSGETCAMRYQYKNNKKTCFPTPIRSSYGNFACAITGFQPGKVKIGIKDFVGDYFFEGAHTYQQAECDPVPKSGLLSVNYCEKSDFWSTA